MDSEIQRVIDRVRKMIALANDAGATEGERDNAMRMSHKLLAKHNLSMACIEQKGGKGEERVLQHASFYGRPWAVDVAYSIARLFFCHYVANPSKSYSKYGHIFIGKESNAITAAEIAEFVVSSIRLEAGRLARKDGLGSSFERSFSTGASISIMKKVSALIREASQQKGESVAGTSLVLASVYEQERTANQEFKQQRMKTEVQRSNAKRECDAGAYNAGMVYGDKIQLNRQVTEERRSCLQNIK